MPEVLGRGVVPCVTLYLFRLSSDYFVRLVCVGGSDVVRQCVRIDVDIGVCLGLRRCRARTDNRRGFCVSVFYRNKC